uniref:Uncharacterized protein n=1 Tax=Populus alba TaxID=43335 RepID=A0A4U5QZ18_POPAL|nr:hypothetical protein D5086_0000026340 [Populus alba]
MWVKQQDYKSLLLEQWHTAVYSSLMYVLCRWLKLLKGSLKQLNKLHFGHISERVRRAEADLDQHQKDNAQLLAQDNKLRMELVNLKSAEKMFYSQKLKCNFFKDNDRWTSFFHALMNEKHKKSFIPVIHRIDGSLTTSVSEVRDVFVSFFNQFLGTSRATSFLDESIVYCGPFLDSTVHVYLLDDVSNDDIKKALFSIGDINPRALMGTPFYFLKILGVWLVKIFVLRCETSSNQASFLSR